MQVFPFRNRATKKKDLKNLKEGNRITQIRTIVVTNKVVEFYQFTYNY